MAELEEPRSQKEAMSVLRSERAQWAEKEQKLNSESASRRKENERLTAEVERLQGEVQVASEFTARAAELEEKLYARAIADAAKFCGFEASDAEKLRQLLPPGTTAETAYDEIRQLRTVIDGLGRTEAARELGGPDDKPGSRAVRSPDVTMRSLMYDEKTGKPTPERAEAFRKSNPAGYATLKEQFEQTEGQVGGMRIVKTVSPPAAPKE